MSGALGPDRGVPDEIRRPEIDIFCFIPLEELEACGKEGMRVESEVGRCVAVIAFVPAIIISFIYRRV
jgi:hypothetical protein